tara:strand:+ start:496 stop:1158 length:663 start_codon:yes stop_codon:yes gene_type:complete
MHDTVNKIISIEKEIQQKIIEKKLTNYKPTIVAISKTFSIDKILPLINYGHNHFGENKVQEALEKWNQIKETNHSIKLHMVGKLQTNKVKNALRIFDYIHSLDSIKLAEKIANEQKKLETKPKLFIQINIGKESQKSGIDSEKLIDFYQTCKNMDLNIIGTMCLPPENQDSNVFFSEMKNLNKSLNLSELSMGMSYDYINAIEHSATYIRIGSKIFGNRT